MKSFLISVYVAFISAFLISVYVTSICVLACFILYNYLFELFFRFPICPLRYPLFVKLDFW